MRWKVVSESERSGLWNCREGYGVAEWFSKTNFSMGTMKRIHCLAAEIFFYSYDNCEGLEQY